MKGDTVFLYTYFIGFIGLFNALEMLNKFVKDESLKGYKCLDENIVFNMTRGKSACAFSCWVDLACASIIYFQDTGKCTGCSSFTGVTDTAVNNTDFYKRGYQYLGCYDDCPRILTQYDAQSSSQQSTEYCLNRCRNMDASFSLTEYGNQCFCGVNVDFYFAEKIPESKCSWSCAGNVSQKCGGSCIGSLYRTALNVNCNIRNCYAFSISLTEKLDIDGAYFLQFKDNDKIP